MSKRTPVSLINYFLRNSPLSQLHQLKKVLTFTPQKSQEQKMVPSNQAYLEHFLKSVEVVNQPASLIKRDLFYSHVQMNKFFHRERYQIRRQISEKELDQLLHCIKEMSALKEVNLTTYQQLEQRIVIAKAETILAARIKLTYIFKILLNRRDKLLPESLELEANVNLGEAIIKAFAQNKECSENNKEWSKLHAMEKFMRAREYKKQGYNQIAINNFEEIFRDDAAADITRLQALKILCLEGEQLGDASTLELLAAFTHQKGEKEYEEYLKMTIKKIKESVSDSKPE